MNFDNIKRVRDLSGLNQSNFWNRVGVTQSGGSRYETGRRTPEPVKKLLTVAYGTESQRNKLLEELTPPYLT